MKQLEIRLRVRNNLLVARRMEMGYETQIAAAQAIGMTVVAYNGFECLRTSPVTARGEWTPSAHRIADFHGVSPADLWPEALRKIKQTTLTIFADPSELIASGQQLALPADSAADVQELHDTIMAILDRLRPEEREIVMLYFGISGNGLLGLDLTLQEIADRYGISSTRVRQIIQRVLRDSKRITAQDRKTLALWYKEPPDMADAG